MSTDKAINNLTIILHDPNLLTRSKELLLLRSCFNGYKASVKAYFQNTGTVGDLEENYNVAKEIIEPVMEKLRKTKSIQDLGFRLVLKEELKYELRNFADLPLSSLLEDSVVIIALAKMFQDGDWSRFETRHVYYNE